MFCCSSSDVEKIGWIATFQLKADGVGVDGVRGGQREIDRWIDGEGNREGDRERERERDRERERETERERERQRETERERGRQTEREGRTTVVEISRIKRLFMLIKRDNWG